MKVLTGGREKVATAPGPKSIAMQANRSGPFFLHGRENRCRPRALRTAIGGDLCNDSPRNAQGAPPQSPGGANAPPRDAWRSSSAREWRIAILSQERNNS